MRCGFFISDRSMKNLHAMARGYGYPPQRTAAFLAACLMSPDTVWQDRRPSYVRELPPVHGAPAWWDGTKRRQHTLGTVPTEPLLALAETHIIRSALKQLATLEQATTERATYYRSDTEHAICSAVLEAIGMGWLVPVGVPAYVKTHA